MEESYRPPDRFPRPVPAPSSSRGFDIGTKRVISVDLEVVGSSAMAVLLACPSRCPPQRCEDGSASKSGATTKREPTADKR